MISLWKERTGGDTGAVTGKKSKDGNLDLGIETRSIKRITSLNRSSAIL